MGLAYDTPFPATPEHDKLKARKGEHEAVVSFLNWTEEQGLQVVSEIHDGWSITTHRPRDLVARYFDVDATKYERENQAVLEWARRDPEERA